MRGGATARPSSDIPGTTRGLGVPTRKDAGRSCSADRGRRSRGSSCAVLGRRQGGARRPPWRAGSRRAAARWRRTRASSAGRIAIARGTRRYRSCTSLASVSVQTRNATRSSAATTDRRRAACPSVSGRLHWRRAHACFGRATSVRPRSASTSAIADVSRRGLSRWPCSRRSSAAVVRATDRPHPHRERAGAGLQPAAPASRFGLR